MDSWTRSSARILRTGDEKIQILSSKYVKPRTGRWKTLPQSVTFERDLYDPVVGLANAIVALEDPNAAFRWFKHGDNPLTNENIAKRKVDIVFLNADKGPRDDMDAVSWKDVKAIGELKRDEPPNPVG